MKTREAAKFYSDILEAGVISVSLIDGQLFVICKKQCFFVPVSNSIHISILGYERAEVVIEAVKRKKV